MQELSKLCSFLSKPSVHFIYFNGGFSPFYEGKGDFLNIRLDIFLRESNLSYIVPCIHSPVKQT